ncbi:hypothetical protein D3C78_24490 [compost metagenome]
MRYLSLLTFPVLLACATVHADSGGNKEMESVGIVDETGALFGLRFAPPDEEGWTRKSSGLSVTLEKNADSNEDSREIEAYPIRLNAPVSPTSAYIDNIKRNLVDSYKNNKEFKISTFDVTQDPNNSRCTRVHLLLESKLPDQTTQERKWSEQYTLSCGFLKYKGMGFELRYYHRYIDSKKDDQFIEDARRLLDSVVIDNN